jgi:hypothetical protein
MIVPGMYLRIWKETAVAFLKALNSSWQTEETHEKPQNCL